MMEPGLPLWLGLILGVHDEADRRSAKGWQRRLHRLVDCAIWFGIVEVREELGKAVELRSITHPVLWRAVQFE